MRKIKEKILGLVAQVATFLGVPSDKMLHFSCAMLCMIVVSLLTNDCIGLITALAVSIGKELYDKFSGKGCAEWGDLISDFLGMLVGYILVTTI